MSYMNISILIFYNPLVWVKHGSASIKAKKEGQKFQAKGERSTSRAPLKSSISATRRKESRGLVVRIGSWGDIIF